jgi:hypothetical protein
VAVQAKAVETEMHIDCEIIIILLLILEL